MNRVLDFLVFGFKGMLGHLVTTHLREQGFYVIVVSRSTDSHSDEVLLDLRDSIELERFPPLPKYPDDSMRSILIVFFLFQPLSFEGV